MKRYDHGGGWSTEAAHGKWVLYEDSRELVAALQVAHEMEVKNLKSEIDALKAELAALKAPPKTLKAEEVTEAGYYWWRDDPRNEWEVVEVEIDSGGVNIWKTRSDVPAYDTDWGVPYGEFLGPIKMEV